MSNNTTYKIRFFHGIKNLQNDPIYSFRDISEIEYLNIKSNLLYQMFLINLEKAYELIVFNYKDYELSNFSIILDYETAKRKESILQNGITTIDRHISNILTSTYIYTCLLRVNDIDYKSPEILVLKKEFQRIANSYHATRYQYTFMSALRNIINHSGTLEKLTSLGGTWSSSLEQSEHDEGLLVEKKDKRFPLLDMKISKEEAKRIIKTVAHYNAVQESIPAVFYLRQAIRVYISLLSQAHAVLREQQATNLKKSSDLIASYLANDEYFIEANLLKYNSTIEQEKSNLFSSYDYRYKNTELITAPLGLEHYYMPGEYELRPPLDIHN